MDFFIFYVGLFFIFFLIMPMVYFALQFILWIILNKCCGTNPRGFQDPVRRRRRRQRQRQRTERNVFNAQEDPSSNRYGDIFFIEPGSVEANRIRDQLEKDEKDLPSYDEVMRMCNLTTPTAAAAGMPVPQSPLGEPSPIGIAALPAPPYSETDPNSSSAGEATVIAMEPMEPSTSRAAQIPPSSGSGPPAPLPTTAV
ncbi:uncharacterized protein LOC6734634 isoform X5 [Drosophila simulans]|uniref:Uncharacterized protein, isoform E n=2 Tax=melanogaster subgroup TaxID=32351 RepID=A0A0J9RD89_DROSI|nr:uncharacterized protein LOC6734634 isoform X5 [Drosophila simulans]XP_033153928.1 uncharacterized protein LOC117136912 isoform X4 [Drosophila mauritiana]KMY94018.1 uncharacterized protein Dsimw501_GD11129, isoform E [Drosophila simulans]